MTRLAFGAKVERVHDAARWQRGRLRVREQARAEQRVQRDDAESRRSAAEERPPAHLAHEVVDSWRSIPGNQFVQVQHRPGDRSQGRKADGVDVRRQRRLAFAEQLACPRRIGCESFQAAFVQAAQNGALFSGRRAVQRAVEYPRELPSNPADRVPALATACCANTRAAST